MNTMLEFRVEGQKAHDWVPGEVCLLALSHVICLFPQHRDIRMAHGWTIKVCEEDWPAVEQAYRTFHHGRSYPAPQSPMIAIPAPELPRTLIPASNDVDGWMQAEFDEDGGEPTRI